MHYPWWHVPVITSPMLIAIISILHVIVSHYAVGGGIFLAIETAFAYKNKNNEYLRYLKSHAWFFILVTVVYGAVTGVGIWWSIGLASPLATEMLIRIFVFGWAMEYVFFILEIISAFIFYYYWGRLDSKTHIKIGWIYAVSAWISLVLITGITAFMLNSGNWPQHKTFWTAFFNPQFIPQVLIRTGGAILLASVYVYLHASFKVNSIDLRNLIGARSARPSILGASLIIVGSILWLLNLPEASKATLEASAVLNIFLGLVCSSSLVVFLMLFFGPYRNPGWVSPGFAILLFLFGFAAVSAGEFVREAIRKPYIIHNVVMSHQLLPEEVAISKKTGMLNYGKWIKAWISKEYPQLITNNQVDYSKIKDQPISVKTNLGSALFIHHCGDCHALDKGYSPVIPMLRGWTRDMIMELVKVPNKVKFFMPPWSGNEYEAELLTDYLTRLNPPSPIQFDRVNNGEIK
jgi:cytochrome bd-type quinol oxidase subunit 1